ncbi:hypothetical protein AcW1_001644 [Taiwanofungus camphoratus]|nr:hypothetical protein AcV7_001501 [Antrodia cinnamomea]KAI0945413.1 hypothetical protein AcW1_001644 [Antrodia cinnamomea]
MDVLKQQLNLSDEQLDEDPNVALVAIVTSSVCEENSVGSLLQIAHAIEQAQLASHLEPLILLPVLLPCADEGAAQLINMMGQHCSAKEVVMAVQESVEMIQHASQSEESEEDHENDREDLSVLRQMDRMLRLYAAVISRLPLRKKTPSQIIQPLFSDMQSVILQAGCIASAEDGRTLIASISRSVVAVNEWIKSNPNWDADERSKSIDILYQLLTTSLEACANCFDRKLAQAAFERRFPRLVVPPSSESGSATIDDVVGEAWTAVTALNFTLRTVESRPSLGSLILLAHSPSYVLSLLLLESYFPVVLVSVQSNTALDEVLSLLINALAPLRSQSPRPDLPADLVVPLAHVLPPLASAHPDPSTRHQIFRILSIVLALAPSPLRLHLLHGLLADRESPPPVRVAAVGLVKEAVLEALATAPGSAEAGRNVFASPLFLRTLGPVILRPDPPELFTSGDLQAGKFLDTPEPLRLVECLACYYVLLQRDGQNRTGVRDQDRMRDIETTLLHPLRDRLKLWNSDASGNAVHGDDAAMQLAILDMWQERVSGAIEDIRRTQEL